jgi:hypothetical protein
MAIPKVYIPPSEEEFDRQVKFERMLRDKFALAALPALINQYPHICKGMIAEDCYSYADAMLSARKRKADE